ncbi:MAG: DUF1593 domain-containing protein [Treponema sp.]|nr:DUF1593 domain-containing protein [Treponema sp.]
MKKAAIFGLVLVLFAGIGLISCEGPEGPRGIQGLPGEPGEKGDDGAAGQSIQWRGELASAPANPQNGWAYYNTANGRSYIYWDGWQVLSRDGEDGVDGIDILWKGELVDHPDSPELNWAYYNVWKKIAFIYNGSAWEVLSMGAGIFNGPSPINTEYEPFRVIITTDPELDDLNSLIHMLLYSNEIPLVGLVYNFSQHHISPMWDADGNIIRKGRRWTAFNEPSHIDVGLNAYEQAYPYLVQHDSNYPTPAYLKSITKWGNVHWAETQAGTNATTYPDLSVATEGSNWIKQHVLDDVPGKLFITGWGGMASAARALEEIANENAADIAAKGPLYQKIVDKVVLSTYGFQDRGWQYHILPNFPDMMWRSGAIGPWGYGGSTAVSAAIRYLMEPDWMSKNVTNVGPLGKVYRVAGTWAYPYRAQMADDKDDPLNGHQWNAAGNITHGRPGFDDEDGFYLVATTAAERTAAVAYAQSVGIGSFARGQIWLQNTWVSEGDSPTWAFLVNNGLRSWQHPTYGGWGGRLQKNSVGSGANAGLNMWGPATDAASYTGTASGSVRAIDRYWEAIMHSFATRLQWTIKPPSETNHPPLVEVHNSITDDYTLDFAADPGDAITLTADFFDPDGDTVSYRWWQYQEADTYASALPDIPLPTAAFSYRTLTFTVPADANPGDTIHVICEVKDNPGQGRLPLTKWARVIVTVN